jgi:N-acetylneuraminic acid mutarotase
MEESMKCKWFSVCLLLSLLLSLFAVQPASAADGIWTPTGSMSVARWDHSATLLSNGKVLVAGGYSRTGGQAIAELYNPSTGAWTTTGSMIEVRGQHTATLLADGRVLITGGSNNLYHQLPSAELYNPATGLWTSAGDMALPRGGHTATLLANGKVLVVGGSNIVWGDFTSSAELYDPATNTWSSTGSMHTDRGLHAAVPLPNGKVLVMGGIDDQLLSLGSAELYDPETGTWTPTGALKTERDEHTTLLLSNGTVLAFGGVHDNNPLSSAELYDPATGVWTETGSMVSNHNYHAAALLSNGKVLVSAGTNSLDGLFSSVEVYDPATGTWTETGSLGTARADHAAVLLPNGAVLAVGGWGPLSEILTSAELYRSTPTLKRQSAGAQDGWITETNETSNQGGGVNATASTFVVGDNAKNGQHRAILHFNTSALPDNAVVTRVVLKVKKQSVTGTDPFTTHGKIAVDIRKGAFSNANPLQPTDFQAAANKPSIGAFVNLPQAGGWYVTKLSSAAFPYIHRSGITQFRLRFQVDDDNDETGDFIRFYSGNAPAASRPVLLIQYYVP